MTLALCASAVALAATGSSAKDSPPPVLIKNALIFDGRSEALIKGRDVLVENSMISEIGAGIAAPKGAQVIDAAGGMKAPVPLMGLALQQFRTLAHRGDTELDTAAIRKLYDAG